MDLFASISNDAYNNLRVHKRYGNSDKGPEKIPSPKRLAPMSASSYAYTDAKYFA